MQRAALYLSGIVFLLVAAMHAARLALGARVLIGDWSFPMWGSGIAVVVLVMLAWVCFRSARR